MHARLSPSHPVGGVVLGGDFQGLGIVRSLGRRGVPVCVVDDETSISRFSRYATSSVHVPDLRDEETAVAAVLEVGERLGLSGWVLYPTRDEIVAAFSRHRERLAKQFRVVTADWSKIQWAWDKRNTYRLAESLDIPAPKTWYASSLAELPGPEALPVAIKPAIKEHFIYATKAKAWRADTPDDLVARFEQARKLVGPGEVLVQELIPGNGRHQFAYCAFVRDGRPVGSMTVRRWRQHPPEFGRASTFVETVEVPVVEELSARLLESIDYSGLVEIEYKRDPRDGQFKLLDFNARTWGYHSLGQAVGVDFPYMAFADAIGNDVAPCRGRPGVRWIRLVTDLPTGALEIARGRRDWRAYLRSVLSFDTESVFSRDDPVPGVVELALVPYLYKVRGF